MIYCHLYNNPVSSLCVCIILSPYADWVAAVGWVGGWVEAKTEACLRPPGELIEEARFKQGGV